MKSQTAIKMEVTAGITANEPLEKYTREWRITQGDLLSDQRMAIISDATNAAFQYASSLQGPASVNWVRVDWNWTR